MVITLQATDLHLSGVHSLIRSIGINFSFAKSLFAEGCNVLFADLALRPEAQELVSNHGHASKAKSGAKSTFQQTDVRDWKQLERMFHVARKEYGDIDVVCPGAGVYEPVRILWNNEAVLQPCSGMEN